jgi:hypothetical protein
MGTTSKGRASKLHGVAGAIAVGLVASIFGACGTSPNSHSGSDRTGHTSSALNIGDPVLEVDLPSSIDCSEGSISHVAISVAAVPVADIGRPDLGNKVLLTTTCRTPGSEGATIYFIDPGSSGPSSTPVTGTIVQTLTVDLVPPNGWGAMAFRGDVDVHDLIACSNPASDTDHHAVYSINLTTGHATHMFDANDFFPTTGRPYCDGLAWDSGSDTIYMGPDIGNTIYHYTFDGILLNTLPVPTTCTTAVTSEGPAGKSGILAVGPNLLVACDGLATIFEISKADGSFVTSFSSGANRAEDMECDKTTFGPDLSVAWTKDAFEPRFLSFAVPPGTCGLCRNTARRDLNNDLTSAERTLLASLELDYITGGNLTTLQRGQVVATHRAALNSWHTFGPSAGAGAQFVTGGQFFPGHRGYIGDFEFWLQFVTSPPHPEFVPLPKWNPANPIPAEFQGFDQQACTDSTQLPPVTSAGNCSGNTNTAANFPLPCNWVYNGTPTTGLCAFADISSVQNQTVSASSCDPTQTFSGNFEGDFHGNVHCNVGGTMCDVTVSPSTLIFFPWHAFVDDVAYAYECQCKGSCAVCTDVFTPFTAGHEDAGAATSAGPNLAFWWWFEDEVVPPVLTPHFVTDHSGLQLRGDVRSHPKLVPGLVGQALELDGHDDFVVADDRNAGEIGTSNLTLDAWVHTSASGLQPIVSKVGGIKGDGDDDEDDEGDEWKKKANTGYALFLIDGQLGLFLGTTGHEDVFVTSGLPTIADGAWHHVAAVVDREYATRSKLFVDGQVALQFDGTVFTGSAKSRSHVKIGKLRVGDVRLLRSLAHEETAFFSGLVDEIDLFRSALPPDHVASIFVAGSAGKFGSRGNLPTTSALPPCIDLLGQRIGVLSSADAPPFQALYNQVLTAVANGNIHLARTLARQIATLADSKFDRTYLTAQFMAISHQVDACLTVPPLNP